MALHIIREKSECINLDRRYNRYAVVESRPRTGLRHLFGFRAFSVSLAPLCDPAYPEIRVVPPVWKQGQQDEQTVLRQCYTAVLELAAKCRCEAVSLPLVTEKGPFFPKHIDFAAAVEATEAFLKDHSMDVNLLVARHDAREKAVLLADVERFLFRNYSKETPLRSSGPVPDGMARRDTVILDRPLDVSGSGNAPVQAAAAPAAIGGMEFAQAAPVESLSQDDAVIEEFLAAMEEDEEDGCGFEEGFPEESRYPQKTAPLRDAEETEDGDCMPRARRRALPAIPRKRPPEPPKRTAVLPQKPAEPHKKPAASREMSRKAPQSARKQAFPAMASRKEYASDRYTGRLPIIPDLDNLDAGFSETLLNLIDKTGKKDSEIYNRANVSRQHFSKIRNNPDYKPTKATAIAFAIALELDMQQTEDLISRAGYTLTRSSKFDVIIMYFIQKRNYNMFDINETLYEYDQSLLGA